jgi:hypothetical protein
MLAPLAGDIGKWLGGYIEMAAIVEPLRWSISGCCRCPQRFVAHAAACRAGVVVGLAAFWRCAFLWRARFPRSRPVACVRCCWRWQRRPVAGLF